MLQNLISDTKALTQYLPFWKASFPFFFSSNAFSGSSKARRSLSLSVFVACNTKGNFMNIQ